MLTRRGLFGVVAGVVAGAVAALSAGSAVAFTTTRPRPTSPCTHLWPAVPMLPQKNQFIIRHRHGAPPLAGSLVMVDDEMMRVVSVREPLGEYEHNRLNSAMSVLTVERGR